MANTWATTVNRQRCDGEAPDTTALRGFRSGKSRALAAHRRARNSGFGMRPAQAGSPGGMQGQRGMACTEHHKHQSRQVHHASHGAGGIAQFAKPVLAATIVWHQQENQKRPRKTSTRHGAEGMTMLRKVAQLATAADSRRGINVV